MPEEQAFSVLVKIMFDYGLRDLFKQNFEDLHCKFFQLERLMQVCVLHLHVSGAKSHVLLDGCVYQTVGRLLLLACFCRLAVFFRMLLLYVLTCPLDVYLSIFVFLGVYTWFVQPLPECGSGGSYVCFSVVLDPLHSQVSSLHGLPYNRPATVWGWSLKSHCIAANSHGWFCFYLHI